MKDFDLLSRTVSVLRFPLAFLIVVIHSYSFDVLSTGGNYLQYFFSNELGRIAVPLFFVFSGFFFFYNIREFTLSIYKGKIKKRLNSLFIPYVIWNLIYFLAISAGAVLLKKDMDLDVVKVFWLGDLVENQFPVNYPLWFVRNLIVVSVLSPLFYFVFKNKTVGTGILIVFSILYVFEAHWVRIESFWMYSFDTLFFFGLGAFFASIKLILRHCVVSGWQRLLCFGRCAW